MIDSLFTIAAAVAMQGLNGYVALEYTSATTCSNTGSNSQTTNAAGVQLIEASEGLRLCAYYDVGASSSSRAPLLLLLLLMSIANSRSLDRTSYSRLCHHRLRPQDCERRWLLDPFVPLERCCRRNAPAF